MTDDDQEIKSKLKISISVSPDMHKLNNTEEMHNFQKDTTYHD